MFTQASHHPSTEAILPDAVFGADASRQASPPRPSEIRPVGQLPWIDRALLLVAAITTILVASIVAVGAAVVLTILFVIAAVIGLGRNVAIKARR